MLREDTAKHRGVARKSEASFAVLGDLEEKGFTGKKAVAEILLVVKKARDVRLDAEKKVFSLEMKWSMLMHKKVLLDGALNAVNKELSSVWVECATLRWNRDEVLSRLKTLETHPGKSLKVVSERTTGGSWLMSKQFGTEVAQGL